MSELLRSLRATRQFAPRPVAETLVREILDVARWTGSARNRQPWRVAIMEDADDRSRLSRFGAYAAVLADAPLVILLALDHDLGGADAEFDAGRFAQSLMLAAHSRGIGSCPVSFFPTTNVEAATRLIGLDHPWRVRTAIALGYPARAHPTGPGRSVIPTGRHPIEAIVIPRPTEPTLAPTVSDTAR